MVGIDQPKMRDTPGAEFREAVDDISDAFICCSSTATSKPR
jgi:hypothetical protein